MRTIARSLLLLLPLLAGCAKPEEPAAPPPATYLAFCYQTLADIACYDARDKGRELSFVGVYRFEEPTSDDRVYWLWQWRAEDLARAERALNGLGYHQP